MRQWRVGSLSMGLVLITLGIILLASLLKGYSVVDQLLTWWPVILVVLGLEVLSFIYFSKQEQPKIKYDLFSILIISVIGFLSIGFYTLNTIGIIPKAASIISSSSYSVVLPETTFNVPDYVKTIIIEAPAMPLEIKGSSESDLGLLGKGEFAAISWEEAVEMAARSKLKTFLIGDNLYVYFEEAPGWGDFNLGAKNINYTLVLPKEKQVEIKRNFGGLLTINGDIVNKSWIVDGPGKVRVNVNSNSDLKIRANVSHSQGLTGNVEWTREEKQEGNVVQGIVIFKEGRHVLNIIRSHEVEVFATI